MCFLVWLRVSVSACPTAFVLYLDAVSTINLLTILLKTLNTCFCITGAWSDSPKSADLHALAEPHVCLQAFFGFFGKLNSYWVAPMVNVVFLLVAVATQLFLTTAWGRAVLAWLDPKHAFVKAASGPQPDKDPGLVLGFNSFETNTERQCLLVPGHWNSMQSTGPREGQNTTQLEMLYEGPTGLSVEMAEFDGQQHMYTTSEVEIMTNRSQRH